MSKALISGGELHYETQGEGTPLLLVSGLGGLANYWLPNVPTFAKHYRTIVHDHRGTGQSTRSLTRYSVEQMTDDVLALMDHLQIERAHVVGHSTGGAIGQTMEVRHPDRLISLTIYASWTKADPYFQRVFEARRALLMSAGARAYVRSMPVFLYPDWWINENIGLIEEREKLAIANFPPVEIVASRIDAIMAFDRTADLAGVRTPTCSLRQGRHPHPALLQPRTDPPHSRRRICGVGPRRPLRVGNERRRIRARGVGFRWAASLGLPRRTRVVAEVCLLDQSQRGF